MHRTQICMVAQSVAFFQYKRNYDCLQINNNIIIIYIAINYYRPIPQSLTNLPPGVSATHSSRMLTTTDAMDQTPGTTSLECMPTLLYALMFSNPEIPSLITYLELSNHATDWTLLINIIINGKSMNTIIQFRMFPF